MSEMYKIAQDAVVLACDAHKALFLRNVGTPRTPKLATEEVLEAEKTGEVRDSDRPGRLPDKISAGGDKGPRSAMEQPDWHRMDAEAFAVRICAMLEKMHRKGALDEVLIAAPPEMLGLLRRHMPADLEPFIKHEIHKDLTKMPIDRLTRVIAESD